ncbi:hypothetical protein [Streptomyces sp. S4.7]|nr:hypothetical protein [Streptomyces sp. S4.7]
MSVAYDGNRYSFSAVPEGKYSFRDGDNKWRVAGYKYRTCG